MEQVDCVVIGAGVIGLAIARIFAMHGQEVIIAEAADTIGTGISARNSEVIHAGLYYPENSLKARLCTAGRHMLYDFAKDRGIAHAQCGKLLVATHPDQHEHLDAIRHKAHVNGVHDLQDISQSAAHAMEPHLQCSRALWCPATGIIDSHGLMMQLLAEAEHHGAMLACNTRMIAGAVADNGIHLTLQDRDGSATHCMAQHVINCAGLHASAVARSITGLPARCAPQTYFCKGHYFSYTGGKPPFSRLIYPIPERAGLGIHVTLDLAGQIKFGPDTVWLEDTWREHESYDVPLALRDKFLSAIGRYFPSITAANLQPAYAGVRPKLVPAGSSSTQDFVIQAPQHHGIAGFYNLLGIESPGLTSCLAIAQYVHALYTAATHRHNPCTISTLDD